MKKLLYSVLLTSLFITTTVNSSYAKSFSSPSNSSKPTPSFKSTPTTPTALPSFNDKAKINNLQPGNNTRSNLTINDSAKPPTDPVKATLTPNNRSAITNNKPANAILSDKVYNVNNPSNLPTVPKYVTRYDDSGRAFTIRYNVPIGINFNVDSIPDSYFGPSYRRTTTVIYDNTNTGSYSYSYISPLVGWIFFFIICGVIVIVIFRNLCL